MKLYITRHGETLWNIEKRFQGRKDSPLTNIGKKQAELLGKSLKHVQFDKCFTSPSFRCYETADIILKRSENEIVKSIKDERLTEIYLADWEGKLVSKMKELYKEELYLFWHEPERFYNKNGENFIDVKKRVKSFLKEIIDKYNDLNNILIVTHATPLKMIMSIFENRDLSELWNPPFMKNTALNIIEINNEVKILKNGDLNHINIIKQGEKI